MLTFTQFLTEKLAASAERRGIYIEVWKNPTAREFSKLIDESQAASYNKVADIGGWLEGKNLYVWDRGMSTHNDARGTLRDDGINVSYTAVPLYITPMRGGGCRIRVSEWSASPDVAELPSRELLAWLRKLPALKYFKSINMDR